MKITIALVLLILVLTSCAAAQPTLPIAPTQTLVISSQVPSIPANANGFVKPEPATWVDVMPAVREYLFYRKKSIVSGDVSVLWKRYPDLQQGMNTQAGINIERNSVQSYGSLKPFDGNIYPQAYEQIKVKMSGDTVDVLVHGSEMYLVSSDPGKFDESGSEFRIILSLRKQGGLWTVYQTTDITGP
jgi:hypothetical protein